jgi:hypothetical protein
MNVGERPRQLTVEVTQEDIDKGIARDSTKCVIADAIRRQNPGFQRVSVDLATIRISDPKRGLRCLYFTPPSLQKIIIATDQGKKKDIQPCKARLVAGQVVPIKTHTAKEKAKLRRGWKEKYSKKKAVAKKMLDMKGGGQKVPVISGGKLPPIAPGSMRTFGLRGLRV